MLSVAVQHAIGGCTVAAPQHGGRARTAPGASGADRPQPPANALSIVLTARSTARCSGHKLLLGGKKDVGHLSHGPYGLMGTLSYFYVPLLWKPNARNPFLPQIFELPHVSKAVPGRHSSERGHDLLGRAHTRSAPQIQMPSLK